MKHSLARGRAHMLPAMLDTLLRLSPHAPPVRLEVVSKDNYSDAVLDELHALATVFMAEDRQHFRVHAYSNDVVHLFRDASSGAVVGFQFWRTAPCSLEQSRIILGGKLRILPAFRSRSLHLLSGLVHFLHAQTAAPDITFYRLSLASLFGFVSLVQALREYHILHLGVEHPATSALCTAMVELAADSHFDFDPHTGLADVRIFITPENLNAYRADYFSRPAAKTYIAQNPGFRDNGKYLAFWFPFSPDNVGALMDAIRRKLWP